MRDLVAEPRRPFGDGAVGWTQNFTLAGREYVLMVERRQAAEASAPHRKPATWWTASITRWEPQIETLWKGHVSARDGKNLVMLLRFAKLAASCSCCYEAVPWSALYGSDWLVCEACVDDASPIDEAVVSQMSVVA